MSSEGIIDGISKDQQEELFISLNTFMESIENKITKLITNLFNSKVKNEISKLIDDVLNDEKIEFFSKEIIEENKSLRFSLEKNTKLLEDVIKNPDLKLFEEMKILTKKQEEEISALNKNLEEIKDLNKRVKQKLASSPYLPFLVVRDFETLKIKEHNCLCFYCGFDINKKTEINVVNNNNTQINNSNLQKEEKNCYQQQIKPPDDIDKKIKHDSTYPGQDIEMLDFSQLKKNGDSKGILNEKISSSIENDYLNKSIIYNENSNLQKDALRTISKDEKSNKIRSLFLNPIQDNDDYFQKRKSSNFQNFSKKDSDRNLGLNEENTERERETSTSKSPNLPQSLENFNQNNINSSNTHNTPENENCFLNEEENKNLEILYKKLYKSYLGLKFEKNFSYQSLIKSKPFQILINQIENCINTIDNQKSEISHMKKHLAEVHNQISSQEKFYKFDKMKDVNLLEEKIEKLQKDIFIRESEKQKMQIEINKLEEFIKSLNNFDYSQLTSIDEFYKNKNVELIEMLKNQAKLNSEKFQNEYERCECFEKSNLKLQMELDRFKTALSKYENVEGVESKLIFIIFFT
jgi:hypothetical protein